MGKSTIYDDLFIKIWTFYQKKCWKHDLLGEPPPKSSLVHVLMGRSSKYTYNSYTEIRHVMVIQHIYIYMESGYTKSRIYILYLHNVAYHIIWYLYHNHITYNTPLNNHLIYIQSCILVSLCNDIECGSHFELGSEFPKYKIGCTRIMNLKIMAKLILNLCSGPWLVFATRSESFCEVPPWLWEIISGLVNEGLDHLNICREYTLLQFLVQIMRP